MTLDAFTLSSSANQKQVGRVKVICDATYRFVPAIRTNIGISRVSGIVTRSKTRTYLNRVAVLADTLIKDCACVPDWYQRLAAMTADIGALSRNGRVVGRNQVVFIEPGR